jgi:hypothetical protein
MFSTASDEICIFKKLSSFFMYILGRLNSGRFLHNRFRFKYMFIFIVVVTVDLLMGFWIEWVSLNSARKLLGDLAFYLPIQSYSIFSLSVIGSCMYLLNIFAIYFFKFWILFC